MSSAKQKCFIITFAVLTTKCMSIKQILNLLYSLNGARTRRVEVYFANIAEWNLENKSQNSQDYTNVMFSSALTSSLPNLLNGQFLPVFFHGCPHNLPCSFSSRFCLHCWFSWYLIVVTLPGLVLPFHCLCTQQTIKKVRVIDPKFPCNV